MLVKQLLITPIPKLQCSYRFKAYSLNNRLFAQNGAPVEHSFYAFRDLEYIYQTRITTALRYSFTIPHNLEDNIDSDSFLSNAPLI